MSQVARPVGRGACCLQSYQSDSVKMVITNWRNHSYNLNEGVLGLAIQQQTTAILKEGASWACCWVAASTDAHARCSGESNRDAGACESAEFGVGSVPLNRQHGCDALHGAQRFSARHAIC